MGFQHERFSEVLRRYSIRVGMKAEEMAQRVHVRRQTVSSWMNGTIPRLSHLLELTTCLLLAEDEIETLFTAAGYPQGWYAQFSEGWLPIKQSVRKAPSEPRNPYKGLRPFSQQDTDVFFGRESLIHEWLQTLEDTLMSARTAEHSERFLAIIGASGTGKTSTVQAGLLPALRQGAIDGSQSWLFVEPLLEPEPPLQALCSALANYLPTLDQEYILHRLKQTPEGLLQLTRALGTAPEAFVLILVDQCEKLFTPLVSEQERRQLIELLVVASTFSGGNVFVVLILRADFYGQPMAYPLLAELIRRHQVVMAPIEQAALRDIIEKPAGLPDVDLRFEHHLVDLLLHQVEEMANPLPFLQFTLEQLYRRRNGCSMTVQALEKLGGVQGALVTHAEYVYQHLLPSESHRVLTKSLFLRLILAEVETREASTLRRRRASLEEFECPDLERNASLMEVLAIFIQERLLTVSATTNTYLIEVSHEALLRVWPRPTQWLAEEREVSYLIQTISRDQDEWERRDYPKDRLYRGSQLKEAQTLDQQLLSEQEVVFLKRSVTRRQYVGFLRLGAALVLLLVAVGAGWLGLHQAPDPHQVTTTDDSGTGSLRWAIANALPGTSITFAPNVRGTITIKSELTIDKPLTVRGPGAQLLALKSLGRTYGLHIVSGVHMVSFSDLSFTDGNASPIVSGGYVVQVEKNSTLFLDHVTVAKNHRGGIRSEGTVMVSNSIIAHNMGGDGIMNMYATTLPRSAPTMSVSNSIITNNVGSGIENFSGTLSISHSIVTDNAGLITGGVGNYNTLGRMTISNSIIAGNTAVVPSSVASVGGVFNSGTLAIANTTISGNRASFIGGIENTGGTLTIANSTISGNSAVSSAGHTVVVGGIENNYTGTMMMVNTTIFGNTSVSSFSAINSIHLSSGIITMVFCTIVGTTGTTGMLLAPSVYVNEDRWGMVTLENSIVVKASLIIGPGAPRFTVQSEGDNLVERDNAALFQQSSDRVIQDLTTVFGGDTLHLANNGGATQTLALLLEPRNPAFEAVPPASCQRKEIYDEHARLYVDQRGRMRPGKKKTACDIGAYETQL